MRRRAESMMWAEQPDVASVRAYFAKNPPLSSRGQFVLARALLAQGDRAGAQAQVRDAWRTDSFGADLEARVIETFGGLLSAEDHKARMNMRLYADDMDGGLRNANRAGGDAPAIAKARIAVMKKAGNAKAALDAVPSAARRDLGYIFSLAQWLRRNDREAEAGELILSAPRDASQTIDTDQWWIERRLNARNMLDLGDAAKAYRIARDAAVPKRDNYRAEHQFTAGWIALRFVKDPATALTHFAQIAEDANSSITLARAHYWLGRTYEAQGRNSEARQNFQAAAQHPTAYYGQLAGAKLGLRNIALRTPPSRASGPTDIVRAMELLYAVGQRDMVAGAAADLGDRSDDAGALAAIGEVAARNNDARTMLLMGKAALSRGLPLENYAFPTIGMPNYTAVGPAVEKPLIYAIARQESTFNQKTISSARAMGLMQVTPAAGKYVARKFNVTYNEKKLLSDPVYNVQLGAAELGDLLADFRGLVHPHLRRLQRRPRPHPRLGRALRRSPRPQRRPGRLGGADSVLRDAQLCPARDGKHAGLSNPFRRRRQADDRGRPAARRQRQLTLLARLVDRLHAKALRSPALTMVFQHRLVGPLDVARGSLRIEQRVRQPVPLEPLANAGKRGRVMRQLERERFVVVERLGHQIREPDCVEQAGRHPARKGRTDAGQDRKPHPKGVACRCVCIAAGRV